jgi:hypothetical protein
MGIKQTPPYNAAPYNVLANNIVCISLGAPRCMGPVVADKFCNFINENKILFSIPNQTPTYFISIKDLIVNKMLSGRAIDKLDVEELQKINMHSKDKSILATLKKIFGNL